MDKRKVESFKQRYDVIVRADSGTQIEYWYARELMPLLGYERWENFKQYKEQLNLVIPQELHPKTIFVRSRKW